MIRNRSRGWLFEMDKMFEVRNCFVVRDCCFEMGMKDGTAGCRRAMWLRWALERNCMYMGSGSEHSHGGRRRIAARLNPHYRSDG